MPEISNSVRQRLGARPAPLTHPDADSLTAYVEQVLPAGERNQLVEHLAACAFCRDIVALSLPELPEKTLIHSLPAPSRFWTFGLRWAGGLAVIAIAVTLVIERPGHNKPAQSATSTVAATAHTDASSAQKAAEPARPEIAAPALSASVGTARPPSPLAGAASNAEFARRDDRIAANSPTPAAPPALLKDGIARNEVVIVDDKESAWLAAKAVNGLVDSNHSPQPVPAQPNQSFVNSNIFAADERSGPSNYVNSYNLARQEQAKAESERAKKAQVLLADAGSNSGLDANAGKGFLRTAIPKINPTRLAPFAIGVIKTATTGSDALVERAAGAAGFASSPVRPAISPKSVVGSAATITHGSGDTRKSRMAKPGNSEPLHWRVQDGKLINSLDLNQWHEAYPQGDDFQFKVVQTHGHEVWAGGTNGTLVHSWDGGVDWQKLNLGDAAAGDIEKISLSGADVQVKTSNGQHLITRDGGKTWAPLNPQNSKPEPHQPK